MNWIFLRYRKKQQHVNLKSVADTSDLTEEQLESNRKYTEMMKQVLSTPYFYFSYNFDISHSRQRFDEQKTKEFLAR